MEPDELITVIRKQIIDGIDAINKQHEGSGIRAEYPEYFILDGKRYPVQTTGE